MSGFGAQHPDDRGAAGASWRALSGDPLPQVPNLAQSPADAVHGGWQQPWQDEQGQAHYPYSAMQPAQAPPYAEAAQQLQEPQPVFVAPEQLAPVGPPRYLAPARAARDPRQRTMAAVITFITLLIGLWGILGFMGAMSQTLSSIASGNQKLKLQMAEANKGLVMLDEKTSSLEQMDADATKMQGLLTGINSDMATMLTGVNGIADGMSSMSTSLTSLDTELGKVSAINTSMSTKLGAINKGLANQVRSVRTMRRDVQATGTVLGQLPGRLRATNGRLTHVNKVVDIMGCQGITNNLKVNIKAGPIPTGAATVYATVIPPGAWGTRADGRTPC